MRLHSISLSSSASLLAAEFTFSSNFYQTFLSSGMGKLATPRWRIPGLPCHGSGASIRDFAGRKLHHSEQLTHVAIAATQTSPPLTGAASAESHPRVLSLPVAKALLASALQSRQAISWLWSHQPRHRGARGLLLSSLWLASVSLRARLCAEVPTLTATSLTGS